MHADRDGHATPNRTLFREPAGLGVGSIRHRRPFHHSAKVVSLPEALSASPTAVHAARDEQPTPLNKLTLAPAGFGVPWTLHRPSFHRSTNVTPTFEAVTRVPTPTHEEALVQVPNKS
jgi:hypothetical protein